MRRAVYNDRLGRVIRQVDALGKETVIDRDSHERLVKVTYPEGNSVQYAYDARHNPLTVTVNPKPGSGVSPLVSRYTYDPTFSKVVTATDPLGRVTRHTIDPANGNLLRVDYPAVGGQIPRQNFVYDGRGQVTSVTDPMGKVTSFAYDGVTGALTSVTDDAGRLDLTVSYTYDAAGNVASRTDPLGRTTSFAYDGARRLIQRTSPSPFNYRTQWVYNADGNVVQLRRQSGSSTWSVSQATWSPSGRKLTETSPAGNVTTYAYDALDRVWKVTDAENRTTETRYDGVGRVAMVVDALGNVREQYAYSDNGLPRSLSDARGRVTVYGYDGFDRLSRVTQPDGSYAERGYDASGNVVSLRTRSGQTIVYGHDALNRRVRKVYPGGVVVSFGYDLSGRPTEVTDGGGTLAFGYDSAGRPVSQTWPDGKVLQSEYDAAGQRTRLIYPDGWSVNWSYDGLGRPTAIVENGTRNLVRYTYDALSRRTQAVMGNSVTSTYTWNTDDQLTRVYHYKVGRTPPVSFVYGRNRVGQISSVTATDGRTVWRPAANDTLSASVNDLDQYVTLGTASLDYDMAGNLSGDGVVGYGYDAENRLVSATQPGHTASYAYDGLGRRRSKTVDGVTTRYLQDGADEVAEVDGAGGQLLRKHVFGPGVDAPVLTIEADGTRTWHLADGQGNVVWQASNTGADVALTGYGPWGESIGTTGAFRYAGARFDAETGLVYLRARHYSPTLGRFLQPDPVGTAGGVNLYAYALNDPINRRDPRGTTSEPVRGDGGNWGLMGGAGDDYLLESV